MFLSSNPAVRSRFREGKVVCKGEDLRGKR